MKKVNYSDYEGKYDENILTKMATSPESIDVEEMRATLYGYTFTPEYAKGIIPDALSMDYWRDHYLDGDDDDEILDLEAMMHEDKEGNFGLYLADSPQEQLILQAIDSTGDGKSEETALCVINVQQEYEYIERAWCLFNKNLVQQSVNNGIDKLELQDDFGNTEVVYFDVSRCFETLYYR